MTKYNCTVCKNDDGYQKPCQITIVGCRMEHTDLCVVTGEFGVAEFIEEE